MTSRSARDQPLLLVPVIAASICCSCVEKAYQSPLFPAQWTAYLPFDSPESFVTRRRFLDGIAVR
jgi:hypothetical protein